METTRTLNSERRSSTIYPVILAVPDKDHQLSGREKVERLRHHARKALEISAQKSAVVIKALLKNQAGAPVPFDGNYWSLTHKPKYSGGVIAPAPIGIDIEKIRSCSKSLFRKTALDREWCLSDMDPQVLFFRYWTAKESVLKASGTGIKGLSKCRVIQVIDDDHLRLHYQDREWTVEHFYFDGHIASVVQNQFAVQWTLVS